MTQKVVVYVTSEVTLHSKLKTYSGGLGEVAGSMARAGRDLPIVGCSLLYRGGYGEQEVNENGMTVHYPIADYSKMLKNTGTRCHLSVRDEDRRYDVYVDIWECSRGRYGTMPFYFLDTDIDANNERVRSFTRYLYGGSLITNRSKDLMIWQSIVLGVGTVLAMEALGFEVLKYHLNESHAVFTPLYLLNRELRAGTPLESALDHVRKKIIFTNHTPVDAGNPKYDIGTVLWLSGFHETIDFGLMHRLGGHAYFDATLACLRLSSKVNAVSLRHLEVCRDSWGGVSESASWSAVTNGVSPGFWQDEFASANTIAALMEFKKLYKRYKFYYILGKTGKMLNEEVLTIDWFRRFAEYKRPKLIFSNMDWLRSHLEEGHFQLVMGGKPHPDDRPMIDAWNEIWRWARELPNLVLLNGYDPEMSKIVKQGSDLWMMSSRAPLEACITSTISAAMVGANIMSIRDGWIWELDPVEQHYFLYGTSVPMSMYEQDAYDAASMREVIDSVVLPEFKSKQAWWQRQMRIRNMVLQHYTDLRMMREYWDLYGLDEEKMR